MSGADLGGLMSFVRPLGSRGSESVETRKPDRTSRMRNTRQSQANLDAIMPSKHGTSNNLAGLINAQRIGGVGTEHRSSSKEKNGPSGVNNSSMGTNGMTNAFQVSGLGQRLQPPTSHAAHRGSLRGTRDELLQVLQSRGGQPPTDFSLEGHLHLPSVPQDPNAQTAAPPSSWGPARAEKDKKFIVRGVETNPLLEDPHLRILLGELNSDLMLRVQRASKAFEKLWELTDTDGDGMVSIYEAKNAFVKWSVTLAQDSDKYFTDEERTSEPRISYARFLEIFLPLALTVPPEQLLQHLSNRFGAALTHHPDQTAASTAPKQNSRKSGNASQDRSHNKSSDMSPSETGDSSARHSLPHHRRKSLLSGNRGSVRKSTVGGDLPDVPEESLGMVRKSTGGSLVRGSVVKGSVAKGMRQSVT